MTNSPARESDRSSEWFVPRFGPPRFRLAMGLLFLPYTGMVLSFVLIGSLIPPAVHWDRVAALEGIYFLALGIAAHALDALGSKGPKPWGNAFARGQLVALAAASLAAAYGVAIYYMVRYVPMLWFVAVLEGFFLLAYNLEWFQGRFHSDFWFSVSWGFFPVLAGFIMQTNRISAEALAIAVSMALFSRVEIKASRPYKHLKKSFPAISGEERSLMKGYEAILKSISFGVILLGAGLLLWRLARS